MRGGTNLLRVRDYNQQVVLEAIRRGDGVSRVELARETGLTAQTISNIVKRLLARGLVKEAGKGPPGRGGKPRTRLRLNPDSGYAIGVQIDRDEVRLVLVDLQGAVVERDSYGLPSGQGPEEAVALIADSVRRLLRAAGIAEGRVLGLGVASPGPLDPSTGIVYGPPGFSGWREVDLKRLLEERIGYTVLLDNDAVAAAVGERWVGEAHGVENFISVYGGWGLGAGLFLGGRVYRGATGTAGELAHTPLDPDGPECSCGNRGCLIRYCSPGALAASVERKLRSGAPETSLLDPEKGSITYDAVRSAAVAGDRLATEALEFAARMLGKALVIIANLLDVEMIVLAGRAFEGVGYLYQGEIATALGEEMLYRKRRQVHVRLSKTGQFAGAVGAASLILHAAYAPRLVDLRSV